LTSLVPSRASSSFIDSATTDLAGRKSPLVRVALGGVEPKVMTGWRGPDVELQRLWVEGGGDVRHLFRG
jgi:hypothetical protein